MTPTISPTNNGGYLCPSYYAANTNYGSQNTVPCYFNACPGVQLTISACMDYGGGGCYSYRGEAIVTFIRLQDASGNDLVNSNTNIYYCGGCSTMHYTIPSTTSCQVYRIMQGCWGSDAYSYCSGQFFVSGGVEPPPPSVPPSAVPTVSPTVLPTMKPTQPSNQPTTTTPTILPTLIPTKPTVTPTSIAPTIKSSVVPTKPSAVPSFAPVGAPFYCPIFAVSNNNRMSCQFKACPGHDLWLSSAMFDGGYCSGPSAVSLRLFNSSGQMINFRTTGYYSSYPLCKFAGYSVPSWSTCQVYTLSEGCEDSGQCSGQVIVQGASMFATAQPTNLPTAPTMPPTMKPTQPSNQPTTTTPTILPTFIPSKPTVTPTYVAPTIKSSVVPTTPSAVSSFAPTGAPFLCPYFSVTNNNRVSCLVMACPGQSLSLSPASYDGGYCFGPSVVGLRLYDSSGNEVSLLTSWYLNEPLCKMKYYYVPLSSTCQVYTLSEGCEDSGQCSGQVSVRGASMYVAAMPTNFPTAPTMPPTLKPTQPSNQPTTSTPTILPTFIPTKPTVTPTYVAPTFKSSLVPTAPSAVPSFAPTGAPFHCPIFEVTNNSRVSCLVMACPGQSLLLSPATYDGGYCFGPSQVGLRLYNSSGDEILLLTSWYYFNEPLCNVISYDVPLSSTCQIYTVSEGCVDSGQCNGQVSVRGASMYVAAMPTNLPTAPTMSPTMKPTQPSNQPTIFKSSVVPTAPISNPLPSSSMSRSSSGGSDNFLTVFFAIFGSIAGCLVILVFGYTYMIKLKWKRIRAEDLGAKMEINNQQQHFNLQQPQPEAEMNYQQQQQQQYLLQQPQPQPQPVVVNNNHQQFYLQQPQQQPLEMVNQQQQQQQYYLLQQPQQQQQQQYSAPVSWLPARSVIPVASNITVVQERQPFAVQFGHTVPSAPPMVVEEVPSTVVYPTASYPSNEHHSIEMQRFYANTNNTYNNNYNSSSRPEDRSVLTNNDFIRRY